MQLLEGIGAIKKDKKSRRSNYQEDVTVPLTEAALDDAAALDDDGSDSDDDEDARGADAVLRVVPKARALPICLTQGSCAVAASHYPQDPMQSGTAQGLASRRSGRRGSAASRARRGSCTRCQPHGNGVDICHRWRATGSSSYSAG